MRIELMSGPVKLDRDDRWTLLNKCRYGEDYYVHPDADVYSDVFRAQWIRTSGLIATLDYYVRKEGYGDGNDEWKVIEKVHFYDPDEGDMQITPKFFQQKFYPATEDNLRLAVHDCISYLNRRDNSHLTNWWEEWKEER